MWSYLYQYKSKVIIANCVKTLISLFEKVYFHIFVILFELAAVKVLSINLNQRDIGIHNNLAALQAPTGCLVATMTGVIMSRVPP